ncbi:hypothetical protein ACFQL1_16120 [Halomicroarcula sp. GCM10025709]|uniref:hypothetical protein n=1 Tax=Haloarcula TaxID=2237 RepID=UPI00361F0D21
MNCWIRAKQKAAGEDEDFRDELEELVERKMLEDSDRDTEEVAEKMLQDDELPEEVSDEDDEEDADDEENADDDRTPEEILYEERWQPKYERSARRVPFGHSRRLTAVVIQFISNYGYMEITQVAMNNLVEEAAENAEGVDPENITIRGLRATAATHYATFIRNPKALQDLLGWTRIETAVRYLRRAGAFTTDVVYHAFDEGDLAPAMFPGEPKYRYPILDNPLPYQNEPYDPMMYPKERRQETGRSLTESSVRQLIHPRAQNHPDELDYDPDNHQLLTHEDYEDDILDRGGLTMFEAPTLAEFYEDHERLSGSTVSDRSNRRYESKQEWEEKHIWQSELFENHGEEDENRLPIRGAASTILITYLKFVEYFGDRLSTLLSGHTSGPVDTESKPLLGIMGMGAIVSMLVIIFSQVGILNLQTMSFQFRPLILVSLAIALYTAYKLPDFESMSEIFN